MYWGGHPELLGGMGYPCRSSSSAGRCPLATPPTVGPGGPWGSYPFPGCPTARLRSPSPSGDAPFLFAPPLAQPPRQGRHRKPRGEPEGRGKKSGTQSTSFASPLIRLLQYPSARRPCREIVPSLSGGGRHRPTPHPQVPLGGRASSRLCDRLTTSASEGSAAAEVLVSLRHT